MTDCSYCAAAQTNPHVGIASSHCRGCQVRRAAKMNKRGRELAYRDFEEHERPQFIADVLAEFRRLRDLETVQRVEQTWGPK